MMKREAVISWVALAVSLGVLALSWAHFYDVTTPKTTVVEPSTPADPEVAEIPWRGTYTVINRSDVDGWATLRGTPCREGYRIRPGGDLSLDLRPGFWVTLCAPGAVAKITDTGDDGTETTVHNVKASVLRSSVSARTEITLTNAGGGR